MKTFALELMFPEGKWSDIVIPKDESLQGLQVLALHEKLGNLGLDGHSVQV